MEWESFNNISSLKNYNSLKVSQNKVIIFLCLQKWQTDSSAAVCQFKR